jgi:CheY-like chemotaxis protein
VSRPAEFLAGLNPRPGYSRSNGHGQEREPGVSETTSARPFGVLVIDDDPAVLRVTALLVQALGGVAFQADGGDAALDLLRRHTAEIDAALIDYQMPVALGPEVRRLLVVERPGLPCCLMSGTLQPGEAPAAGFDQFLAKPFSSEDLRKALAGMGVLPPG